MPLVSPVVALFALRCVVAANAFVLGSGLAHAEIPAEQGAAASQSERAYNAPLFLAPEISAVASGGYWESGERSGTLRVIIINQGQEQVSSRVYLEWLEERLGQPMRRVGTVPIPAINEAPRWSVEPPLLRPSASGLTVELRALDLGSEERRSFVLKVPVEGAGRFQMQRTTD